jgi:hypothetical protein
VEPGNCQGWCCERQRLVGEMIGLQEGIVLHCDLILLIVYRSYSSVGRRD